MKLICFILAITILGLLIYCNFPLATVEGRSMYPTFKDGGVLLTTRLFNQDKLTIGDVYVYTRHDEYGQEYLVVKRLTAMHPSIPYLAYFEGDNPEESYDSRQYGYINTENIVAKVIWQIYETNTTTTIKGGTNNEGN